MTTTISIRLGAILLLASAGCVGPVEIAPLPYAHPANPAAPAGMTPEAGSMLAPDPGGPAQTPAAGQTDTTPMRHEMGGMSMSGGHAGVEGMKAGDAVGAYQCPMHGQVRSDKPGRCPICGMRLVNKGDAPRREEEHER